MYKFSLLFACMVFNCSLGAIYAQNVAQSNKSAYIVDNGLKGAESKPKSLCGAEATCTIKAETSLVFFKYMAQCDQLGGATIIWQLSPTAFFSITSSKNSFCTFVMRNNYSQTKPPRMGQCDFTREEVEGMTRPDVLAALQQYDQTKEGKNDILEQAMRPIQKCVEAAKAN